MTVKQRGGVGGHLLRCLMERRSPMEASATQEQVTHEVIHMAVDVKDPEVVKHALERLCPTPTGSVSGCW
jgi:hypothetical protein